MFTELISGMLSDENYRRLQEFLLISPTAGDLIPGTAGCRKLRWSLSGRAGGKRGGIRVIYYFRAAADQVLMLLAYDHRVVDDLTHAQKKQLANIVKQLK